MDRAFPLHDRALRVLLALPRVAFDHLHAFNDRPVVLGTDRDDLAALAFFGTSQHHHFITRFYMQFHNVLQITSGASEIILMNFFARSWRATGPKMRVPRGFSSLSMMTQALRSNRRYEPSLRRMICRVRTTTASTTSPFFTVPSGAASLIWTLMTSPMPAYVWFLPNTPIFQAIFAPVLSATSKLERTCNIKFFRQR